MSFTQILFLVKGRLFIGNHRYGRGFVGGLGSLVSLNLHAEQQSVLIG